LATSSKRRAPLWARLCAILGCGLMVFSGGSIIVSKVILARYASAVENRNLFGDRATKVSDIKGPVNILLVGIDPRDENSAPLSDSIIVVHVPAGMSQAYLFSVPRDLLVDIPPFAKTGFRGGRAKINAAMSYGSSLGNGKHDVAQGFELLAKTVGRLTGIAEFAAGAIIKCRRLQEDVADGLAVGGAPRAMTASRLRSRRAEPSRAEPPSVTDATQGFGGGIAQDRYQA